jgi:hypothetical protein
LPTHEAEIIIAAVYWFCAAEYHFSKPRPESVPGMVDDGAAYQLMDTSIFLTVVFYDPFIYASSRD